VTKAKRPGPSFRLYVIVIAIGLLVGIPSAIKVVVPFVGVIATSPTLNTPGTTSLDLKAGQYKVYERTGFTGGGSGFNFSNNNDVTLGVESVTVTSPDGSPIAMHRVAADETITRGSRVYTSALGFSIPRRGRYEVQVGNTQGGQIIVSRSIVDTFGAVAPWIATGALAVLTLLVGFTLLIVGSVRRGRTSTAVVIPGAQPWAATGPPPNWYPDPDGGPGVRYWDGARWTDHRA
jgi:hypothetical protein